MFSKYRRYPFDRGVNVGFFRDFIFIFPLCLSFRSQMIYKLSVVQEDVSDACNALMHFKECNSYNVNETNQ